MLRAVAIRRASEITAEASAAPPPHGKAVLLHDERHIRRRAISLVDGSKVLVDMPEPVVLQTGDALVLEDGSLVVITAASEALYEIIAKDSIHLAELAWHIGNRHLAAAIEADRILILRDHVIKAMLEGLGATVRDILVPFNPARGAYSGPARDHGHNDYYYEHGHHDHDDHGPHDHGDHMHDDADAQRPPNNSRLKRS